MFSTMIPCMRLLGWRWNRDDSRNDSLFKNDILLIGDLFRAKLWNFEQRNLQRLIASELHNFKFTIASTMGIPFCETAVFRTKSPLNPNLSYNIFQLELFKQYLYPTHPLVTS
jgi:hypothetical protein